MKMMMNKLIGDEQGQAFLIVLVFLLFGGLTITPLLSYMSTGLKAGQIHEERMAELYAADAGVEDALWQLISGNLTVPVDTNQALPAFTINNMTTNVTIANVGNSVHKITSVATSATGSSTTIKSYVKPISFFDNAITSNGNISIQPGSAVNGTVQYGGTLDNKGVITGSLTNEQYDKWPTATLLSDYYLEDVKDLDPYPNATIDIKNNPTIGPLYRVGDLEIENTGPSATLTLEGTIYVTGDLTFKQPGGPKAYTVDLSGHSIYVEGSITFPPQRVSITGSGCIIAVGDIDFQPGVESNPDDFVFIMSVTGTVEFHPGDDFYGSVAGDIEVDLQPNTTLTWRDPTGLGSNFPIESVQTTAIRTWYIQLN